MFLADCGMKRLEKQLLYACWPSVIIIFAEVCATAREIAASPRREWTVGIEHVSRGFG